MLVISARQSFQAKLLYYILKVCPSILPSLAPFHATHTVYTYIQHSFYKASVLEANKCSCSSTQLQSQNCTFFSCNRYCQFTKLIYNPFLYHKMSISFFFLQKFFNFFFENTDKIWKVVHFSFLFLFKVAKIYYKYLYITNFLVAKLLRPKM